MTCSDPGGDRRVGAEGQEFGFPPGLSEGEGRRQLSWLKCGGHSLCAEEILARTLPVFLLFMASSAAQKFSLYKVSDAVRTQPTTPAPSAQLPVLVFSFSSWLQMAAPL